jgi:hypothetical protein
VIPVAAHGTEHTGTSGVDLITGVVFISSISALAGLTIVFTNYRSKILLQDSIGNSLVGALLIIIGAMAARSVIGDQRITGVAGIIVGIGIGIVTIWKGSCRLCAEVTVGVIAVHKIAEGLVIVGLSASETTISVLGILVLALHTVAESVAIGLSPSLERKGAIGAIISINVVFVIVTTIGASGLITTGIIPTDWIIAITGGLLMSLGFSKFQSGVPKQLQTLPS